MQRLHENDLAGYLIGQGWPFIRYPLIDTQEKTYDLGGGLIYVRPAGETLQRRLDNPVESERTRKQIGSALYNAQYLQAPIPTEGNLVKREDIQYYTSAPDLSKCTYIYLTCDPAGKAGAQNDFTAILVAAVLDSDIYLLEMRREHFACLQIVREIQSLHQQYGTTINLIETTGMGESARQELTVAFKLDIQPVQPHSDKTTRLSRVISKFEGKHIYLPKDALWTGEFERELFGFPNARFDDQVDALIMLLEDLVVRESDEQPLPTVRIPLLPSEDRWGFDQLSIFHQ
jgi:predicted phage terminase large subunit-like protein